MSRKKKTKDNRVEDSTSPASPYPLGPTALVVLGSLVVLASIFLQFRELRVTHFPYVSALVTEGKTTQVREHRGQLPSIWAGTLGYEYQVDGKKFSSTQYSNKGDLKTFSSEVAASRYVTKHPKGSTVMVQYDPANPQSGFLELSVSFLPLKLGFLAALAVLVGVLQLIRVYRSQSSEP